MTWTFTTEELPTPNVKVLAVFKNKINNTRRICAKFIPRFTVMSDENDDHDEYSEKLDAFYLIEGWYECVENWDDFTMCYVTEGNVYAWQYLEQAPDAP